MTRRLWPSHRPLIRVPTSPPARRNNAQFGELSEGAHLFLWGARHWMVAMLGRQCVPLSVMRVFELVGEPADFSDVAAVVLLAARDADRPLAIQPPCSPELSADEEALTRAIAAGIDPEVTRERLRALAGCRPTVALVRAAVRLASSFRAAGLAVTAEGPVFQRAENPLRA